MCDLPIWTNVYNFNLPQTNKMAPSTKFLRKPNFSVHSGIWTVWVPMNFTHLYLFIHLFCQYISFSQSSYVFSEFSFFLGAWESTNFMCCVKAQFSISLTLHNLECFPCCVVHLHHTFKNVMFWFLQMQWWSCKPNLNSTHSYRIFCLITIIPLVVCSVFVIYPTILFMQWGLLKINHNKWTYSEQCLQKLSVC
jgi:hypothetical protein